MPAPWKGWGRGRGPWGGPGYGRGGWNAPWGPAWYAAPPLDTTQYTEKARQILSTATKGQPYTYPGAVRIPLLSNGRIIGELWEDADISALTIGWIRPCRWGVIADLLYQGRPVGWLYVEQYTSWWPGRFWGWGPFRGIGRWLRWPW